jgi:chromosome segregation ATPase
MSLFKKTLSDKDQELADIQSKLQSVETENTDLRSQIETLAENAKSSDQTIATLTADLEAANQLLGEKQAELAEATSKIETAESAVADFDAKVAEKARLLMLEMGHEPVTETAPQSTDIVATFKGLKGQEALDFYKANKKVIHKALSAK